MNNLVMSSKRSMPLPATPFEDEGNDAEECLIKVKDSQIVLAGVAPLLHLLLKS
jgi:hypothetical protein